MSKTTKDMAGEILDSLLDTLLKPYYTLMASQLPSGATVYWHDSKVPLQGGDHVKLLRPFRDGTQVVDFIQIRGTPRVTKTLLDGSELRVWRIPVSSSDPDPMSSSFHVIAEYLHP